MCDAFGFEEPFRLDAPNGLIAHAEIKLDEAVVMLGNVGRRNAARPETVRSSVYAFVDDVAVHHAHALSRGVEVVQPPTDQPFGDRMYLALDLEGHEWYFAQHMYDISIDDIRAKLAGRR